MVKSGKEGWNMNEQKELIQREAEKLSLGQDHLLLSWATGCSKSLGAIRCFERWLENNKKGRGYLVIKETNHENNWKKEFKKWDKEYLLDKLEIFCYASLHKYANTKVGFIILDECHALSEMREDHLSTIEFDKLISLSATVSFEVKQRLNNIKPFYEFHISLQEAIDRKLLPEPEVIIVYEDLDNTKKDYSYKIKGKEYKVSAKNYYQYLENQVDYWSQRAMSGNLQWEKDKWMKTAIERKRFMASQKTKKAKELLSQLQDKRLICFTGSVAQAKELGGKFAVHSKNKNNQELIDDFNSLKSDKLFAVGMLKEGMNLSSLDVCIIVQLDNQEKSLIQMMGRALRSVCPKVYIILLRNTKDEKYLKHVLNTVDKNSIKIQSQNEQVKTAL